MSSRQSLWPWSHPPEGHRVQTPGQSTMSLGRPTRGVVFSHPKENAQDISDKGHHAKAAYHRTIGVEGQVTGGHQQGSHRHLLKHHGQLGIHAFLYPGLTAVSQDSEHGARDGEETRLVYGHRRAEGPEGVQRLHQRLRSPSAVSTSHQGPSWPIRGAAGEERRGEAPPRHGCPMQEEHGSHGDRFGA